MTQSPIERHMQSLTLNQNQVAWKAGVSHTLVSQLYHGKAPLTPDVANALAGSGRISSLAFLVSNALWRRDQGIKLNSSEEAFVEVGEKVTGYTPDQLFLITNGGIYYLDSLLTSIPKAPPVLLAKQGGK